MCHLTLQQTAKCIAAGAATASLGVSVQWQRQKYYVSKLNVSSVLLRLNWGHGAHEIRRMKIEWPGQFQCWHFFNFSFGFVFAWSAHKLSIDMQSKCFKRNSIAVSNFVVECVTHIAMHLHAAHRAIRTMAEWRINVLIMQPNENSAFVDIVVSIRK